MKNETSDFELTNHFNFRTYFIIYQKYNDHIYDMYLTVELNHRVLALVDYSFMVVLLNYVLTYVQIH